MQLIILTGVMAVAPAMSACATQEDKTARAAREENPSSWPADESITRWAETGLRLDPRVAASDVKITTHRGIVTLRGTVPNIAEKQYAKLEVKKIDGVRGIIDELTVKPAKRPDTQIRKDVLRRLTDSPGVRSKDLAVAVVDGAVTLDGTVASWNEKEYATTLAGEVQGAREVTNRMGFDFARPRTNEENRDEILAAINRDPYLTGLPITVRVAGDVATLEGSVGNAYEKERAEIDARRVGSVAVVQNLLAVDWLEERGVREQVPLPTDDEIRRAVRDSIAQDLRLTQPADMTVTVADAVVTLEGSAPDFYQASVARRDSEDVIGVKRVVDLFRIGESDIEDQALEGALEHTLGEDFALSDSSIGVSVHDGVATLTGKVGNAFERAHAVEVAAEVLGIRGVVNELLVRPAVGTSDEALKEVIEARLATNWKTSPVAARIHVVVEDGATTLTGRVDTWSELLEAGRTSRLVDGVTDVINRLTLVDSGRPAISRSEPREDEASG